MRGGASAGASALSEYVSRYKRRSAARAECRVGHRAGAARLATVRIAATGIETVEPGTEATKRRSVKVWKRRPRRGAAPTGA